MVKVLWEYHGVQYATWETEEWMRKKYPELFWGMTMNNFEDEILLS
jgi:hypothetical protein